MKNMKNGHVSYALIQYLCIRKYTKLYCKNIIKIISIYIFFLYMYWDTQNKLLKMV